MARFLKNHGITDAIEDLIRNANRRLVLISPYLQLSDAIKRTLEAKAREGLAVQMVYRTDKRRPEDIQWLEKQRIPALGLENLHTKCYSLLLAKGITDADWQIWRQAKPEEWQGTPVLTARSILNVDGDAKAVRTAADKYQGVLLEETGNAIIEPGARERAMTTGRLQPGTVLGELGRSVLQFKSFPITMMTRHWRRLLNDPGKISKAEYTAAMILGTTLMGAVGVQLNEIFNGRDPLDMQQPSFWGRAALKGGSLGFYGDFLQSQSSQHGTSAFAGMLGPSLGLAEELLNLSQGNIIQALQGEDTHAGAEALRTIKGLTPGSSLFMGNIHAYLENTATRSPPTRQQRALVTVIRIG